MTNGNVSLSQKWGKLTQSPKKTWTTYPIVLSREFSSPTWATAHFFFLHRHAHPSWSQSHGQKGKARVQVLFHLWLKYFLGDLQNSPCKNMLKSEVRLSAVSSPVQIFLRNLPNSPCKNVLKSEMSSFDNFANMVRVSGFVFPVNNSMFLRAILSHYTLKASMVAGEEDFISWCQVKEYRL